MLAKTYPGFPEGVRLTPVPEPLLNRLLADIKDPVEYKTTLRLAWLLSQTRGRPREVPESRLLEDAALLAGIQGLTADSPRQAIQQALQQAARRGVLLGRSGPEGRRWLLNTPANQRLLAAAPPDPSPSSRATEQFTDPMASDSPPPERSSIFALYEDNIGLTTPHMANLLAEAEEAYPEKWLEAAFALAVEHNRRSWSYISSLLRRWSAQGGPDQAGAPTVQSAHRSYEHGPGPRKPGQHPARDRRPELPADYYTR